MIQRKRNKIVILGTADSGKTTTIETILERKKEKVTKIEYKGTTVALDYGNTVVDGQRIHIFATPGQDRFKFMREILSNGIDGAIVVIDSLIGVTTTDEDILTELNNKCIPYVIFANKQDLYQGIPESECIKDDATIIPTIAVEGKGIHEGLLELLKLMN